VQTFFTFVLCLVLLVSGQVRSHSRPMQIPHICNIDNMAKVEEVMPNT
jgi:hypothetical protein